MGDKSRVTPSSTTSSPAEIVLTHSDSTDTREFKLFLETPTNRIQIIVLEGGVFRLPELPKAEQERARVVHSLEKGALTLTVKCEFKGKLAAGIGEGETLFELCSAMADKMRQYNYVWDAIGEIMPEYKEMGLVIAGVTCTVEKPTPGKVLLKNGNKTVTSIDTLRPQTVTWSFDQYDPKTHRLVIDVKGEDVSPIFRAVWKSGEEAEMAKKAIFVRKAKTK